MYRNIRVVIKFGRKEIALLLQGHVDTRVQYHAFEATRAQYHAFQALGALSIWDQYQIVSARVPRQLCLD